MASMGISSNTQSDAVQSLPTAKAAPAQTSTTEKAPATLEPDTVKLSPAAQAKMMHRAGQSPALIAASLGTDLAAVDGYLNITVVPQATTTPAPAQEAQAEPAPQAAPAAQTAPAEQAKPATPAPTVTPEMTGKE